MDLGGEYRVALEVPGASRETVEVTPGPLPGTILAKVEARSSDPNAPMLRAERGARAGTIRYQRVLPVAWDADVNNVKVSLADGILTVTLPKQRARVEEKK